MTDPTGASVRNAGNDIGTDAIALAGYAIGDGNLSPENLKQEPN